MRMEDADMTEREAMLEWAKDGGTGKVICTAYGINTDMTPDAIQNNCFYVSKQKEYAPVTIDNLFRLLLDGKPVEMREKNGTLKHSEWRQVGITTPVAWLLHYAKNLEFRVEVD